MTPAKQNQHGVARTLLSGRVRAYAKLRIGFSLVELLTVIAIITVLSAILIPVTRNVLQSARTAGSLSNLRTIALANQMYASDNNGESVMAYGILPTGGSTLLWYQELRPYVGMSKEREGEVAPFISPSDPSGGGRTGSISVLDWQRRSYSVNYNIRTFVSGSGNKYTRILMSGMDAQKMIFACEHRAIELGTHGVMPSNQASLGLIPTDWHNEKGSAQFVFLDGHVEMIPVNDVMPGAEGTLEGGRYKEWSAFY